MSNLFDQSKHLHINLSIIQKQIHKNWQVFIIIVVLFIDINLIITFIQFR